MKKLLSLSVLASAMALSACGGGGSSDSSGNSVNSTFNSTIANGNQYSCPTQTAFDTCKSDSTCLAAKCTITKQVVTPINPNTNSPCEVSGTTVYGTNGASCSFVDSTKSANAVIACTNNKLLVEGKIGNVTSQGASYSSPMNMGTVTLACK